MKKTIFRIVSMHLSKKQPREWGSGGEPSLLPALRRLITAEEVESMRMAADKRGEGNMFGGGEIQSEPS